MSTTDWILFAALLAAHGLAFVLAMCHAAKRGDELMEQAIANAQRSEAR